jgi:elongation factor 1-gamma
MKLYVNYPFNIFHFADTITAKINNHKLQVIVCDKDMIASPEFKAKNMTMKFPFLETPEGNLCESVAIAKYLAHGHATLNGSSPVERAQVDQWLYWSVTSYFPDQVKAMVAVFGFDKTFGFPAVTQADYNTSATAVKAHCKTLNGVVQGRNWLVGDNITLADIVIFTHVVPMAQTILDAGFRKAMPHFSAWFERVASHKDVVAVMGHVKPAAKPVKPNLAAPVEKKKEEKKAAAPKEEAPKKKEKVGLDALPESSMVLDDFKRMFVNHPDKKGGAVDEFLKMFDKDGWSIYFLHYDMYGDEGKVMYKTQNMLQGFLQRFDKFGKYSFARHCVMGTEEKQEIMGVWMWRGIGIPQECHDHPQFEYMQPRKMDILNNAEDLALLRAFWGAEDGDVINGLPVYQRYWHK